MMTKGREREQEQEQEQGLVGKVRVSYRVMVVISVILI